MPHSPELRDARDARVAEAIDTFRTANGFGPTVREVLDLVGMTSKAGLQSSLTRLREAGTVDWTPGKARTLRVIETEPDA